MSKLAREAEDGFNRNNLRPAYRAIKRLSSVPAPAVSTLLRDDGTVVMGHEGCRERLAEYFEELYNVPPPAERLAAGVQHAVVAPDPPIIEIFPLLAVGLAAHVRPEGGKSGSTATPLLLLVLQGKGAKNNCNL